MPVEQSHETAVRRIVIHDVENAVLHAAAPTIDDGARDRMPSARYGSLGPGLRRLEGADFAADLFFHQI
jgi:hypothetical protein